MANDTEKRITAKMVLDSSGFNESLQGVNSSLRVAQSELKNASASVGAFGKSSDNLKSVQQALSNQIELQSKKVDIYRQSIEKTSSKMQDNITARDKLKSQLDMEKAKLDGAIQAYGKESEVTQNVKAKVEELTQQYNDKEKAVESNAKTLNNYTTNMNKANAELTKMQGELKNTNTELAKAESGWLKAGKAMQTAGDNVKKTGDSLSKVGNTLSVGVSAPLLGVGVAATKMAMDAIESENLFEVSMGDMAKSARDWSEQTSKALGLNAYAVRENVGTFNVMLTSMGQTKQQALQMSEGMTQLAYDMASFYNLKPEEAFEKLKSGISGETEPLKSLGILINDTQVKTYALTHGIIAQGKEMTDAQKVQARYALIMQDTSKAQGDLARTMDSPTNQLRIQTEQIKQTAIEYGTKLIPLVSEGLKTIKPLVDYLANLSDAQKDQLLKIGMLVVAAGPLLSITGKVISVGGSVIGTVGKVSEALGKAKIATEGVGAAAKMAAGTAGVGGVAGLGASLGTLAIAAAPWLIAGAAVAGTGYLIYKGMTQEAVPAVDLFADKVESTGKTVNGTYATMGSTIETTTTKISDSTKKAVGAYIKMDDDAKKSLMDLYISGNTITNQTVTSFVTKYNNMGTQIKAGMDKHLNDEYTSMQQFFNKSNALTTVEEARALDNLKRNNIINKTEIDNYTKQIQTILQNASAEKRSLSVNEQQEINAIQEKMKVNAVKSLSDSEVESKVILERIKDYGTRITAEQASNEIKNANKARDGSVAAANSQYSKTVAEIIRMRDESHSITSEQADKLIADAKRQRDDSINAAEELRGSVVSKISSMNSNVTKDVDTTTGNMKDRWDKFMDWWNNVFHLNNKSATVTTSQRMTGNVERNWTGNNYFQGGLTFLHDEPGNSTNYELYDLPRGTRIFNHDASQDLVIKTAESVATKVANSVLAGISNISNGGDQTIIIPVNLDGREIGKVVTPYVSNNLTVASIRRR